MTGSAGRPGDGRLPLPALLSQLLVAFTIEFDNEFEHQMPHRTTNHGSTPGASHPPFLVSMVMWVNCMRFVPDDGIGVGELARRAQVTDKAMQGVLKRMSEWWGYLVIEADPADTRRKPPRSAWLARPTRAGRQAQTVWEPLAGVVEDRWRARSGHDEIGQLRACLAEIVSQLDVELPDYLPVGDPRLEPRTPGKAGSGSASGPALPALPALLSKVLAAFALDFERESDLSLGIYSSGRTDRLAVSANILRVLDEQGLPVRDLPRLTGVAKMTISNWLGILDKHRYVVVGPDPAGGRSQSARLTAKGREAQDTYRQWAGGSDKRWEARFGAEAVRALLDSLAPVVGAPAARPPPLFAGLQPYPGGWRSEVRKPETLPHYPVISHRGGFPDGS